MTAEAVGDDRLEPHYGELLERQRQLIGEYFKKSAEPTVRDGIEDAAVAATAPGR
jgi:hypothetical protein